MLAKSSVDFVANPSKLLGRQRAIGQDTRDQQVSRALEDLVDNVIEASARGVPTNSPREVEVRPTLRLVTDVTFRLEGPKNRENRGVGQVIGELIADLGDGSAPAIPQDRHDIELSAGKERHGIRKGGCARELYD